MPTRSTKILLHLPLIRTEQRNREAETSLSFFVTKLQQDCSYQGEALNIPTAF